MSSSEKILASVVHFPFLSSLNAQAIDWQSRLQGRALALMSLPASTPCLPSCPFCVQLHEPSYGVADKG